MPEPFPPGSVVRAKMTDEDVCGCPEGWWALGRVERVVRILGRTFYRVGFSFSDPIGYSGDFSEWFRAAKVREPGPGPHILFC